jgi:hypothetical protein
MLFANVVPANGQKETAPSGVLTELRSNHNRYFGGVAAVTLKSVSQAFLLEAGRAKRYH